MAKNAGRHVVLDLYGVDPDILGDEEVLATIIRASCVEAGATVLSSHFHHFGEGYGVTGVVILAESHASVHTWPEHGLATLDVYMCGECDPQVATDSIKSRIPHAESYEDLLFRGEYLS